MSTAIVVGAGVAGCTIARMLAEQGMTVTVYEQTGQLGGILRSLAAATIDTADQPACSWLAARCQLETRTPVMRPPRGYGRMCEELIQHKAISVVKYCTITDIELARATTPYVVTTASLDRVLHFRFGELPWAGGQPVYTETSMQQYQAYARLLGLSGIFSCGSLATFAVLSIPQILRQAMTITDAITCPQSVVTPTTR